MCRSHRARPGFEHRWSNGTAGLRQAETQTEVGRAGQTCGRPAMAENRGDIGGWMDGLIPVRLTQRGPGGGLGPHSEDFGLKGKKQQGKTWRSSQRTTGTYTKRDTGDRTQREGAKNTKLERTKRLGRAPHT